MMFSRKAAARPIGPDQPPSFAPNGGAAQQTFRPAHIIPRQRYPADKSHRENVNRRESPDILSTIGL